MKERVKYIVLALLLLIGLAAVFALVKYYLPEWAYYTCFGIFILYTLYLVSNPEIHYWMYIIDYYDRVHQGVIAGHKFRLPKEHIQQFNEINNISVFEIDKRTFDLIMKKQ